MKRRSEYLLFDLLYASMRALKSSARFAVTLNVSGMSVVGSCMMMGKSCFDVTQFLRRVLTLTVVVSGVPVKLHA